MKAMTEIELSKSNMAKLSEIQKHHQNEIQMRELVYQKIVNNILQLNPIS